MKNVNRNEETLEKCSDSCYPKPCFTMLIICSCDQNPLKIPVKEFIFNKITAFNFVYFTVCKFI